MTRGRIGLGARDSIFRLDPFSRDKKDGGGGGSDDEVDLGSDDKPDDDKPDDDESEDEDEPDDDESEDESDEDEKLGEPGKKALEKEREKNKALRKELRDLKRAGKGEPDAEEKAAAAAEARWKKPLVRREATHALKEAGLIDKPDRLLRLLDMDSLDVDLDDETGEVDIDGLDEQIAELRKDYPSLFRKRGSSSIDAGDKSDRILKRERGKRTATQIQADLLLGRV